MLIFQLFPITFAIVEDESKDSWSWFLACIRCFVTYIKGLCVIFDRHKGIIDFVCDILLLT